MYGQICQFFLYSLWVWYHNYEDPFKPKVMKIFSYFIFLFIILNCECLQNLLVFKICEGELWFYLFQHRDSLSQSNLWVICPLLSLFRNTTLYHMLVIWMEVPYNQLQEFCWEAVWCSVRREQQFWWKRPLVKSSHHLLAVWPQTVMQSSWIPVVSSVK